MGVTGCGKSVVAEQLSERLGLPFLDGDDFHPRSSIRKLEHDQPLTEADRLEWTQRLAQELRARPGGGVLACPALQRADRDVLRAAAQRLQFLHLALRPHQALERVAARTDQFHPPSVVAGDFEVLEDPVQEPGVHRVDATQHVDRIVEEAVRRLAPQVLASSDL